MINGASEKTTFDNHWKSTETFIEAMYLIYLEMVCNVQGGWYPLSFRVKFSVKSEKSQPSPSPSPNQDIPDPLHGEHAGQLCVLGRGNRHQFPS